MTQGLEPFELSLVPGRKRGQAGQEGLEEQRLGGEREISGKQWLWDRGQRQTRLQGRRGKPGLLLSQDWGTGRRLDFQEAFCFYLISRELLMWNTNKRKSEAPTVLIPRNKPVKYCCVAVGMLLCLSVPPIHCLLSEIIMT